MIARSACILLSTSIAATLIFLNASAQVDWPELASTEIATGATFPVNVTHSWDGSGRLFVVEQPGKILVTTSNGFAATPFLDISDRAAFQFATEDGLLGLVFPTNYASSGRFYVYYTRTGDLASVISRFTVSTNANVADSTSEQEILVIPEPTFRTLNGGMLAFGPDGYLYIGTGDDGYYFEESHAQNPASLWGKILRIDVHSTPSGYRIPPSNPFVGRVGAAPEIWALGLRNPWRFCFDRANGDFYISDVGQFIAEEIDFESAPSTGGRNYGWWVREGRHAFLDDSPRGHGNLTEPILEVLHASFAEPRSIASGYVYRGPSELRMNGVYFFADFYTGLIEGLIRSNGVWITAPLLQTPFLLSSFGEDQSGNLYVTDYISGGLFRLNDSGRARTPAFHPSAPTSHVDTITITTLTTGAVIRYTTNGTDPTFSDPQIQNGNDVPITSGATLKARAFRAGLQPSDVVSATYFLKAAKPQFNPAQGPVPNDTPVIITSATPGVTIRFTLNGSDPTGISAPYSSPVVFTTNQTLRARAFRNGFVESDVGIFHSAPVRMELRKTGNTPYVALSSVSNQTYRIQYSPDLTFWIDTSPDLVATGNTLAFTNFAVLSHPRRGFFRVIVP